MSPKIKDQHNRWLWKTINNSRSKCRNLCKQTTINWNFSRLMLTSLSLAPTSAPQPSRAATVSVWPYRAAHISAVMPWGKRNASAHSVSFRKQTITNAFLLSRPLCYTVVIKWCELKNCNQDEYMQVSQNKHIWLQTIDDIHAARKQIQTNQQISSCLEIYSRRDANKHMD